MGIQIILSVFLNVWPTISIVSQEGSHLQPTSSDNRSNIRARSDFLSIFSSREERRLLNGTAATCLSTVLKTEGSYSFIGNLFE